MEWRGLKFFTPRKGMFVYASVRLVFAIVHFRGAHIRQRKPYTRMRLCWAPPGHIGDFMPEATPMSCRPPAR